MKDRQTAILVFANSAKKELENKSIQSSKIFDLLNTETLKTVSKTGLPYFHFSEKEQRGSNFAERFKNAINAVFSKGFDTVISIGNDTPHLTSTHILNAEKKLENNDFVLGPSTDGGYYLMGFKKTHFIDLDFLHLPWETKFLQQCLNTKIKALGKSASYLEFLSDLDDSSDIQLILQSHKILSHEIRKILLKIRRVTQSFFELFQIFLSSNYFRLYFNKGSPLLSFAK